MTDRQTWINRAALFELTAMSLRPPTTELAGALASGEFADALAEIGTANGLDADGLERAVTSLGSYEGRDVENLFHDLRPEHSRLFVGAPTPLVSPYAGVWWARERGVEPLLFVNGRALEIEDFMRTCGIGQAEGKNDPLDHIATMCEFLHYVALAHAEDSPDVDPEAFNRFCENFMGGWLGTFGAEVKEVSHEPLFTAAAETLIMFSSSFEKERCRPVLS